ncbi:unnamed protein product [Ambrosiozyma monospora]|uniref:Unnamed protein product n=1 Tax=Ambrosiozyma monospora TaxID=43982 RepID=A0ACB5T165_AMBMO|nr:unnamed protein product [Ambrosiozyma monospora]
MEKIDRCDLELTRSIDELKRSLDKNRNVMMTKAYYLARLKMFMLHKYEIDKFLTQFDTLIAAPFDLIELDNVVPIKDFFELLDEYYKQVLKEIQELEKRVDEKNELDYILEESSKFMLNRLRDLEGWSSRNSEQFHIFVFQLKESVDKHVAQEASVMVGEFFKETGLSFLNDAYVKCLRLVIELLTSSDSNVKAKIQRDLTSIFDESIDILRKMVSGRVNFIQNFNHYSELITNKFVNSGPLFQTSSSPSSTKICFTPEKSPPKQQEQLISPTSPTLSLNHHGRHTSDNKLPRPAIKRNPSSPLSNGFNKINKTTPVKSKISKSIISAAALNSKKPKKTVRFGSDEVFSTPPPVPPPSASSTTTNTSSSSTVVSVPESSTLSKFPSHSHGTNIGDNLDSDVSMSLGDGSENLNSSIARKQLSSPLRNLSLLDGSGSGHNKENNLLSSLLSSSASPDTDEDDVVIHAPKPISPPKQDAILATSKSTNGSDHSKFTFDPTKFSLSDTANKTDLSHVNISTSVRKPLTSKSLSPIKNVGLTTSPGSKFQFKGLDFMYKNQLLNFDSTSTSNNSNNSNSTASTLNNNSNSKNVKENVGDGFPNHGNNNEKFEIRANGCGSQSDGIGSGKGNGSSETGVERSRAGSQLDRDFGGLGAVSADDSAMDLDDVDE